MINYDWRTTRARILGLLSSNRSLLTESAIQHVNDYVAANELEMALEGLCLELMNNPAIELVALQELQVLAKEVGLDKESVYDSNFWASFTAALDARQQGLVG